MNIKRLFVVVAFLSVNQTYSFVGLSVGRAIVHRLVAASRVRGAQIMRIGGQPENQKRAFGTVAGGAAGYYTTNEDDSFGQKVVKTGLGAGVGYSMVGTSQIGVIHTKVKDMHPKVVNLFETAARKKDLIALEATVKTHVSQKAQGLQEYLKKAFKVIGRRGGRKLDGVEKRLSYQMKSGLSKAESALTSRIGDAKQQLSTQMAKGFKDNRTVGQKALEVLTGKNK